MAIYPKPSQPGGPRIHVGGTSRIALERAARLADGWMGLEGSPEEVAPVIAQPRAAEERAGRDTPLEVTTGGGRVIGRADLPMPDAAMVDAYAALGVDRLIVRPWRKSADAISGLEAFARDCIAR
jgi:alkanesulfonate monooxygenase SsuD/methylene tetrahydromethanopterin reductase-like flavin-dependent oxidoreductase (luciferase family)